ncbi:MAG: hypothetical protein U0441_12810 [Polyangiaceae bacterium]
MFCPNCGAVAQPGDRACPRCTLPLSAPSGGAPGARREGTLLNPAFAAQFSDVVVGKAFAFFAASTFAKGKLGWVRRLLGNQTRPHIVSILGRDEVELPGVVLAPSPLVGASLANVTCDKAIYREGRDEVHLLAFDPFGPNIDAVLEIKADGNDLPKRAVKLDARGAAALTLRDLPAGAYEVRFRGQAAGSPACGFTVAAYKLAPLVAQLTNRSLEGENLAVTLRLESFGTPVDGKVQIELTDGGQRISSTSAEAVSGEVVATLKLTGRGPHAINVQVAADAGKTATVPIIGSRIEERSRTVFSTLGAEVTGSLLPSPGAIEVRGVYLEEGATRSSPFRLDRVDAKKAKIRAVSTVEMARVLVIDPRLPMKRPSAVDVKTAPHPAISDERYRRAETLCKNHQWADGLALFREARAEILAAPHPNYAYWIACCHAHLGQIDQALDELDEAIRDGWTDFDHLATDDDLAALRGNKRYEARASGGTIELSFDRITSGETIEIDVPGPMAVLAIGAYVGEFPWEGWAAVITPPAFSPRVEAPKKAVPGQGTSITIETGAGDDTSVYVIVKDARLLSTDTPQSRLAGGIKAFVQTASQQLTVGTPKERLSELATTLSPPVAPTPPRSPQPAMGRPTGGPPGGHRPPPPGFLPPPPPFPSAGGFGPPPPAPGFGPPPPAPGFGPPAPGFGPPQEPMAARAAAPDTYALRAPAPRAAAPVVDMAIPAPLAAAPSVSGFGAPGAPAAMPSPYRAPPPPPPPTLEEPEVLFAGLVETRDGRANVPVRLGPDFADYLVEAFVATGADWASVEARFRAEKEVFVSLDVPAFVHRDDGAIGRAHVGSVAGGRVFVTCDGIPVPLLLDGRPFAYGSDVAPGRGEVTFVAGPGLYEARLDAGTSYDVVAKRVNEPGKIKRLARTVQLLEAGKTISKRGDPSIVALRVLPGLRKPFRALVHATSEYGHACCEQTAAKILSACSLYVFAEDKSDKDRAEAIILAGVERETRMWLRGRGFKMYPESSPTPDTYWGPKASRYLYNLGMLSEMRPSRALAGAINDGLYMARDTAAAYQMEWPPRRPSTCEDAYAAVRFGGGVGEGFAAVRRQVGASNNPLAAAGAVGMRVETAYAAAVLFAGGTPEERARAIDLTNAVTAQFGPNGRLYSTVDSVAAMALMAELQRSGILGTNGDIEVDGKATTVDAAVKLESDVGEVKSLGGLVAVEVTRLALEDWSVFNAALPIKVALEKEGRPTRRLNALDAVDLVVTLESGYKAGDLCWVCLPDALSRVVGGGQVKMFSVDFEGKSEIRIPLAATGVTVNKRGEPSPSFYSVCVRNMFEEERGGNPGPLDVTVAPANSSAFDRAVSVFRDLFKS